MVYLRDRSNGRNARAENTFDSTTRLPHVSGRF